MPVDALTRSGTRAVVRVGSNPAVPRAEIICLLGDGDRVEGGFTFASAARSVRKHEQEARDKSERGLLDEVEVLLEWAGEIRDALEARDVEWLVELIEAEVISEQDMRLVDFDSPDAGGFVEFTYTAPTRPRLLRRPGGRVRVDRCRPRSGRSRRASRRSRAPARRRSRRRPSDPEPVARGGAA